MIEVNRALLGAIASHCEQQGVDTNMGSDGLTIRLRNATLALTAGIYFQQHKGNTFIVETEFRVGLWPAAWGSIVQYHTGWAERESDALAQSVHGWIDGVWPVILALYEPGAMGRLPEPLTVNTITGDRERVEWRVVVGQPIAKCQIETLAAVEGQLARTPPFTLLLAAFAEAVNQQRIRPDGIPHWGHLFASRLDRQPGSHEATLHGEPWHDAVEGLLAFSWPDSDTFMSFRQFFVIQTKGR